MDKSLKLCKKCVLDEHIPNIEFDEKGICNYCKLHEVRNPLFPTGEDGKKIIEKLVMQMKDDGKGKDYDCLCGISGGADSSYLLHLLKQYDLRILAFHFDNGWNSELAVNNIKQLLNKLEIELYTYVVNWEEFKELQKAFLIASTPDVEKVSDLSIPKITYKVANKFNLKYIISGGNFRTEGEIPRGWTYADSRYFKDVVKKYCKIKIQDYSYLTFKQKIYYENIKGIKVIELLDYVDYEKKKVIKLLEYEYGWRNYDGKHYESIFTRWFQSYYLPIKFDIDKRKVHLSALINSAQITREQALEELNKDTYPTALKEQDSEYIKKKLELSDDEFDNIMTASPRSFLDYKSYYNIFKALRPVYKIFTKNYIRRP